MLLPLSDDVLPGCALATVRAQHTLWRAHLEKVSVCLVAKIATKSLLHFGVVNSRHLSLYTFVDHEKVVQWG